MTDQPNVSADLHRRIESTKHDLEAGRGQLERQRRRVDALLWDHGDAAEAKARLDRMERAHALKLIHLDQMIAEADLAGELRLHKYDIHQMALRFGSAPEALLAAVAAVGPDLDLVLADLGKAP